MYKPRYKEGKKEKEDKKSETQGVNGKEILILNKKDETTL